MWKRNRYKFTAYQRVVTALFASLLGAIMWCQAAYAQSTIIYQDDFEGTVSGWSINNTDYDPDVTRFLGRFDNSPTSTSRTFTTPANTDYVTIEFDLYRFDSWDDSARYGYDRFEVDIDGVEIFSLRFPNPQAARSGSTGTVDWEHSPLTGTVELAFGTGRWWFDQLHRFTLTLNNPGPTFDLTLRADLSQGGNDESAGYDNMLITAFSSAPVMPILTASKSVETVGMDYALPNNEVDYTLTLQNTGGPVDDGSLVFVDALPDDVILFTGDLDGAGNAVIFTDNSSPPSGLSCCGAGTIDYSSSTTAPPVFGYTPLSSYDPAVRYIRISPTGAVRDSQTSASNMDFTFRARIK